LDIVRLKRLKRDSEYLSPHPVTKQLFMVPPRLSPSDVSRNEIITSGSGKPFQSFDILYGQTNETTVWVDEQSVLSERRDCLEWKPVESLSDSGPDDAHFTVVENDDNSSTVIFGDGINGRVLPAGQNNIRILYSSGSGIFGNVPYRKIPKVSGAGASYGRMPHLQPSFSAYGPGTGTQKVLRGPRRVIFPGNSSHVLEKRILSREVTVKLQEICNSIKKQGSFIITGCREQDRPRKRRCAFCSPAHVKQQKLLQP
jgi:hypothetical protein